MKVIIELNDFVSIESVEGSDSIIKIIFKDANTGHANDMNILLIDDLKLALRKITAK